jgi:hypothetical protein
MGELWDSYGVVMEQSLSQVLGLLWSSEYTQ